MKTWTIDQMLAEEPCAAYDRPRLEALWAGRKSLTLLDGLDLDIPDIDKVWWACRPAAFPEQAQWIEGIVTRAVQTHALHCGVKAVETWAARWLSGEDRTEAAARAVAELSWAAARAAARYAATEAAARATAGATWAATEAAARAAAGTALAATDAERARQLQDLRTILGGAQ